MVAKAGKEDEVHQDLPEVGSRRGGGRAGDG